MTKQTISETKVTVKATNGYNKPFGIEEGEVYEATKVVTAYTNKFQTRWNTTEEETITGISWTVNGLNHGYKDFREVENS